MKNGTWVVVADGRKVLYLHNHGDNDFIDLRVLDHREQVNPPTRDQGTDQPGRAYDGTGPGRSAMEAADWHQIAEDRFARQVADRVVFMDHGRIVEEAPPTEFFARPRHERTRLFLSQILHH